MHSVLSGIMHHGNGQRSERPRGMLSDRMHACWLQLQQHRESRWHSQSAIASFRNRRARTALRWWRLGQMSPAKTSGSTPVIQPNPLTIEDPRSVSLFLCRTSTSAPSPRPSPAPHAWSCSCTLIFSRILPCSCACTPAPSLTRCPTPAPPIIAARTFTRIHTHTHTHTFTYTCTFTHACAQRLEALAQTCWQS
jgi:hypothetical protein